MATVAEVSAPYANFLVPVLSSRRGVCEVCHTAIGHEWSQCYQCDQAAQVLSSVADVVVPVALSVKGEQLAHELSAYKYSPRAVVRERLAQGLAAVLWRWVAAHEKCVARACGASQFAVTTTVPGTAPRVEQHPLERIVGGIVGATRGRYERLLAVNPGAPQGRTHSDHRFRALRRLDGESLLVVDDTWTSGAHAQSAASALRAAGAHTVAIVVLGRHFNRRPPEPYRASAENYYRAAKAQGWDWATCCVEDAPAWTDGRGP